jgi:1,4-dihydroxy-2-naphthoate octaprenyltransferase
MSSLKIWLEATRPKTLPAAVAPVLLGTAVAVADAGFDWRPAAICLAFALLVQIGTNFANDYLDGIKGTDTEARLGPRRAVAAGLIAPATMKRATILVLAVGFCVGLGLIPFGGWWLLVVGVASVACAWLYTGGPYPLAYNGLGDVFVVLFFGFIAVGCTYYVQTGTVTVDVLLLGLGGGLLVNNILVVNNYRDLEEDRAAGKRTLVVLLGRRWALVQYVVSTLLAGLVVLWFWWQGAGNLVLLGLAPVLYSFQLAGRLSRTAGPQDFLQALKGSALVVAAFGLLFSLGLVL